MKRIRTKWVVMLVAASVAVLGIGACGDSDSSDSGTTTAASGTTEAYQQKLDELYKGTYTEPTGGPVTPPANKNVWVISTGQAVETSVNAVNAMKEATSKLGWKLNVVDGKFDSSLQLTGINQAVAAKADAIILLYIDCAPVKVGLQKAKSADIPVVGIESSDCTGTPLINHVVKYAADMEFKPWIIGWGAAQADWVIGVTEGKANTILSIETDLSTTRLAGEGSKQAFAKCPTCKVEVLEFVGTDFGPKLQQKIEQSLIKNPDANSFIAAYDAVLTSGGAQALVSSGRVDELDIMGGEGSVPGIELIYDDKGMDACIGLPTAQEGFAGIDSAVRLIAGEDPSNTNSGIGWQACDKDNNLPPKGESYQPPVDYKATYYGFWGVG